MSSQGLFAVYAGCGVYVESVAQKVRRNHIESATACMTVTVSPQAAAVSRRDAVRVCQAARAAGVPSWVVRHPAAVAA